jgi:hypothetical protein
VVVVRTVGVFVSTTDVVFVVGRNSSSVVTLRKLVQKPPAPCPLSKPIAKSTSTAPQTSKVRLVQATSKTLTWFEMRYCPHKRPKEDEDPGLQHRECRGGCIGVFIGINDPECGAVAGPRPTIYSRIADL